MIAGRLLAACVALVCATAHAAAGQTTSAAVVTPVFSASAQVPIFMVDCRNATAKPITGTAELRFDGKVVVPDGVIGGPQLDPIPPGSSWQEMVTLYDAANAARSGPDLGAIVRTTRFVPLTPGRHTVAFRCGGGAWSSDVAFFWDGRSASTSNLSSLSIHLVRENRCAFGFNDPTLLRQCPTYTVTIDGEGAVTYHGTVGVTTLGTRRHHIGPQAMRELVDAIDRARFFELDPRYEVIRLPDGTIVESFHHPATTLTIAFGDRKKSVFDFWGAPDALRTLQSQIDEIAGIPRYTDRSGVAFHRRIGVVTAESATAEARSACPELFDAAAAKASAVIPEPDAEPRFKQFVEPEYPVRDRETETGDEVLVVVTIGADGAVTGAVACRPAMLHEQAVAAARQWTFHPRPKPGPVVAAIRVRFRVR